MELLFKTCSAKLFFELLHGSVVKSCLSKLSFKLLFGTAEQKLTCKPISQGEMSISIFRMLRCALKKTQRSWAQSELCWAQSNQSVSDAACNSRAQVALRIIS